MQNSQATQMGAVKIDVSSLLPRLSKALFWLIIFLSSTQLGLHFWPSSSLVYGVRIDYLAPTLYFLDCLIILYLGISKSLAKKTSIQHIVNPIISYIPILLVNLMYSQNPLSSLSWSIHLMLYLAFFASWIPKLRPFSGLQHSARQVGTSAIIAPLTLSILFQIVLATAQFSLGHSVGSFMYYFGERNLSVGSPNIAIASFMNEVVLRSYGTFSHPNILAGWLVIALIILTRIARPSWLLLLLSSLGIFLTHSRAAAITLFGFIIPMYFIKAARPRLIYFALLLTILVLAPSLALPPRSTLSLSQRLNLQTVSTQIISSHPLFGSGAQASISTYPALSPSTRLLQPDHNSFTLFLSWFGIFGLSSLFYSLRPTTSGLQSLLPIFPLLLFDHYLLTSPQGLFTFLLLLHVNMWISHDLKTQNNRH